MTDKESPLSSLSPLPEYAAPVPTFQDVGSLFMKRRHIRVVLLDEAPNERIMKRVCLYLSLTVRAEAYVCLVFDRIPTFEDIENAVGLDQWAILKANYGPVPYWTNARRQDTIEEATQTLYAVRRVSQAKLPLNYILGVVRKADGDYPLAIFHPSSPTISTAIIAADPNLKNAPISVCAYSDPHHINIEEEPYNYETWDKSEAQFPTVFIITVGEAPTEFSLEIPSEHIPPFLQMTLLHSKRLLHQTYDLECFSLQMIHASRALLHAVVSLAEAFQRFEPNLKAVGRNEHLDEDSEDFLLVAPLLAEKLARFLNDLRMIVETEDLRGRDTIRKTTGQTFDALCGEFPGSVVIRHSDKLFRELRDLDDEDNLSSSITEHPKVEIGYSSDSISRQAMDDSDQFAPEKSARGGLGKMHIDERDDWSQNEIAQERQPKRKKRRRSTASAVPEQPWRPYATTPESHSPFLGPLQTFPLVDTQLQSLQSYPGPLQSSNPHYLPHPSPLLYQASYPDYSQLQPLQSYSHLPSGPLQTPSLIDTQIQSLQSYPEPLQSFNPHYLPHRSPLPYSQTPYPIYQPLRPHSPIFQPISPSPAGMRPQSLQGADISVSRLDRPSSLISAARLPRMEPMGSSPRDPSIDDFKLLPSTLASHLELFRSQSWFDPPMEEPPIQPDDAFVIQGLIQPTDRSRFNAFIMRNPARDRYYCRISHDVQDKGESIACSYSSRNAKECLGHVCHYLNYKGYKCEGSGTHPACGVAFTTRERRNDHYAKARKGHDPEISCEIWYAPALKWEACHANAVTTADCLFFNAIFHGIRSGVTIKMRVLDLRELNLVNEEMLSFVKTGLDPKSLISNSHKWSFFL